VRRLKAPAPLAADSLISCPKIDHFREVLSKYREFLLNQSGAAE
jgi:hypothetical protein